MRSSERIQRYLDGEMTGEELKSFQADLDKDAELREELDLHRFVEKSLKEKGERKFRKQLENSYHKYSESSTKKPAARTHSILKPYLLIFPLVAVLILAVVLFINKSAPDNNSVFYDYYTPMEASFGSRSATNSSGENNLTAGISAYYNGDYERSELKLKNYLKANPEDNMLASHYLGIALIELKDYQEAEQYFRKVVNGPNSYYREHSQWYLGLTLLKENKLEEASEIFTQLASENSFYSEKSEEILKKISRIK